jgi:hypothetical protein
MPSFSIRGPLQGELVDFVKASGFDSANVTDLVRDLICLLASYREEDVPLFPEVFILPSPDAIGRLSPGTERVMIGTDTLSTAAGGVLKNCANLAGRGWAIYVAKTKTNSAEFGVFRSLAHAYATSAQEAMNQVSEDPNSSVLLLRNRGHLVVEVHNTRGETFTTSFTSAPASESQFSKHVEQFASAVCRDIASEHCGKFAPYFARLLGEVLQRCHGTLLAAHSPPALGKIPEDFKDGVWLRACFKNRLCIG